MDWDVVEDCAAEGLLCDDMTEQCVTPPAE
jgi:hypothetical protein